MKIQCEEIVSSLIVCYFLVTENLSLGKECC